MRSLLLSTMLLVLVAAACSSDTTQPGGEVDEPQSSGLRQEPVVTYELGDGLLVTINEDWEPTGVFEGPRVQSDDCSTKQLSINGDQHMTVYLVGASCSAAVNRNNGEGPFHASADQLAGGNDITEEVVALGTLTLAEVTYVECTNECDVYIPIVGVIELDDPADPNFPTVVIANDYEGPTRADIRALALALSAAK